jgi:hypothetical protein
MAAIFGHTKGQGMNRRNIIELRLTLIEEGQPDRTQAYAIDQRDFETATYPKRDLGPFNSQEIVELMQRREKNKYIARIGSMLAQSIADYRDDRDGFNGERRAEIIHNAGKGRT